ncbi:hypothetical protein GUJ93_ZPchr0001g29548 [Zizania palustris]|uniref:Uncharacterized protein n=1 Tax=Zizania palustris TaxID=103762 RepID=A0A8J5RPG2_ZIZPA|nr:hypothetical protein GUJ93_ZPchr0001g29548 [Zizania palustris]
MGFCTPHPALSLSPAHFSPFPSFLRTPDLDGDVPSLADPAPRPRHPPSAPRPCFFRVVRASSPLFCALQRAVRASSARRPRERSRPPPNPGRRRRRHRARWIKLFPAFAFQ